MLKIKHLPIDDIQDVDIEKDMTDFKKYYEDLSKDLSNQKSSFYSRKVGSDNPMPNIETSLFNSKNDVLNSNQGVDTNQNKNNSSFAQNFRELTQNVKGTLLNVGAIAEDLQTKNDFHSPKSNPGTNGDKEIIYQNNIHGQSNKNKGKIGSLFNIDRLGTQRARKIKPFKSNFNGIPTISSDVLKFNHNKPEAKSNSIFNSRKKSKHIQKNPKENSNEKHKDERKDYFNENMNSKLQSGGDNSQLQEVQQSSNAKLSENDGELNKNIKTTDTDDLETLLKNLNGKLNVLKATQHSRKKTKAKNGSTKKKSNPNKPSQDQYDDEYKAAMDEYDTVDKTGSASLTEAESAVGMMEALGRRHHGNDTKVYEIKDEGPNSVDIPETAPWFAKMHGDRAIITAGVVVGGIGLLLILASLITVWLHRRRERALNSSNNRAYHQLGTDREKQLLTADNYSLFPGTSSEEDDFSEEEEGSFINS